MDNPSQFKHLAGASTFVLGTKESVLSQVIVNKAGTLATIYNNTAGSGDIVAIIDSSNSNLPPRTYDVLCPAGITVVTTGSGTDLTVTGEFNS